MSAGLKVRTPRIDARKPREGELSPLSDENNHRQKEKKKKKAKPSPQKLESLPKKKKKGTKKSAIVSPLPRQILVSSSSLDIALHLFLLEVMFPGLTVGRSVVKLLSIFRGQDCERGQGSRAHPTEATGRISHSEGTSKTVTAL